MDLSIAITLENSESEIPIDNHFKLYAGPGAGKTTFLTNHIKRILRHSDRLSKAKQIACITYTNIGVDTLKKRLKDVSNDVEISTIHSFCYKHIVKPYLWILKDNPFPIEKLNGHEEIKLRNSQIREFKINSNQHYINDSTELSKSLSKLRWIIKDGELSLGFLKYTDGVVDDYHIKKDSFDLYKGICWTDGLLSHDDVLYFTYLLLQQEEVIQNIIRAKFPFILIDEFQDTSPLQAEIIKLIVQKETKLGIIGDSCQAIFSFQGTDAELFENFMLDDMKLYYLKDNHRSTVEIINVLNHMRNGRDFDQKSPNKKSGEKPIIIVGSALDAYNYLISNKKVEELCTLSFKNGVSKSVEFNFKPDELNDNIDTINKDSDKDRGWRIHYTIYAIEYGKQLKIKDAIKFMKKAYRKIDTFSDTDAFFNLKRLLSKYEEFEDSKITDFNNLYITNHHGIGGKISRGETKNYYDGLSYKQVASQIKITDDNSAFKTIHQSKGDEFDNVLVIVPETNNFKELNFLLSTNMKKEEHRVYYVALSRAKKGLYINIPNISKKTCEVVGNLGFDVFPLINHDIK